MMTAAKSPPLQFGQKLTGGANLHPDPLIPAKDLLQVLEGAYPMLLTRWKRERGMPGPVAHGKYGLRAVLAWVWKWKLQLEEELEQGGHSSQDDEIETARKSLRLERERFEFQEMQRELIPRREYEEAESQRVQMAIATLASAADRMITEGLMPDSSRNRFNEILGEFVDQIQTNIRSGQY